MVRKLQMQFLEIEIMFLLKTERQINGMERMQMFFLRRKITRLLEKAISMLQIFFGIIMLLEKKETAT